MGSKKQKFQHRIALKEISRLTVKENTGMIYSASLHCNQSRLGPEDRSLHKGWLKEKETIKVDGLCDV